MTSVAERLEAVNQRIKRAANACGRDPRSIRLIAVSKLMPSVAIREAYAAGQRDFGENYVQELAQKADELADLADLRLHLIGHLQTNKAKVVVGRVGMIQSVDSLRLVDALAKRVASVREGRQPIACNPWVCSGAQTALVATRESLPLLVEVNLGGEAQKSGCTPGEVAPLLDAIEAAPGLAACGLMTVPPFTENAQAARPYFDQLRVLRDQLGGASRLPELSMGMTLDLEEAVASGATIVRVGTAIFGERTAREAK
jgi:pyridoxal phosphate enzyme (YggS family)